MPLLRYRVRGGYPQGLRRGAEGRKAQRDGVDHPRRQLGRRGDRRSAYLQLQELRRRDRGRRHHGRVRLPVLRQPHRPHRTVCRNAAARPYHPLQTGQKGRQGQIAGTPQGQDPAAPGVPQTEPYRRDQGRVCAFLALRQRCRRSAAVHRHPDPQLVGQQVRLYRDQLLLRPAGRHPWL